MNQSKLSPNYLNYDSSRSIPLSLFSFGIPMPTKDVFMYKDLNQTDTNFFLFVEIWRQPNNICSSMQATRKIDNAKI